MFSPSFRWFSWGATALVAALALTSCAVGPDFLHPAAPDVGRYTKEPLATATSSTDAPTGQPQHFLPGRDIPQEWWRLFRSSALTTLIQRALSNNPTLQSAIATLRAANQAVYAQ
jgi:outer membrane protein TolC